MSWYSWRPVTPKGMILGEVTRTVEERARGMSSPSPVVLTNSVADPFQNHAGFGTATVPLPASASRVSVRIKGSADSHMTITFRCTYPGGTNFPAMLAWLEDEARIGFGLFRYAEFALLNSTTDHYFVYDIPPGTTALELGIINHVAGTVSIHTVAR